MRHCISRSRARRAAALAAAVPLLAGMLLAAGPAMAQELNTAGAPASPSGAAASGVDAPADIAKMTPRYLGADMRSAEIGSNRSVTVIKVTNTSGRTCSYGVEYKRALSATISCTVTRADVAPMDTAIFCSRGIPDSWAVCTNICGPELLAHDGTALIYSSNKPDRCERMAVNAVVINSNADDSIPYAARNAAVINWSTDEPKRGSKGD